MEKVIMLKRTIVLAIVVFIFSFGTVNANVTDDLIAYYPFEGNSNDVINGYDGFDTDVTYTAGAVGQSVTFNGNGFIEVPNFPGLETWTISFWVFVDKFPAMHYSNAVGMQSNENSKYNWSMAIWYNNWLDSQFQTCTVNNWHQMHPGRGIYVGKWYHIVSTLGADGTYRMYYNGILANARIEEDIPCASTTSLLMGCPIDSYSMAFQGAIDELRIYGVAKTPEEVKLMAEAGEWVPPAVKTEPQLININVTPKKLNAKDKNRNAVLPVIITISDNYQLSEIDIASIQLEGISPIRSSIEEDEIALKFRKTDIVATIGEVENGDIVILKMAGFFADGTAFIGEDEIIIKK
jgi:hypothetical protein